MKRSGWLRYYRSRDGRRFLLYQAIGLATSALVLGAIFGDGRLDLATTRWFFDTAHQSFPLANRWLLKTVLHDDARTMSVLAALAVLGTTAASWLTTQPQRLHEQRLTLLLVSATCLTGAATVIALKHFSSHACPWDLAIFGSAGNHHVIVGAGLPAQVVDGCSPAAHPLTGYAWLGIGFALFPWDPLESTCRHASLSIL